MTIHEQQRQLLADIEQDFRATAGLTGRFRPDERVMRALTLVPRHQFVPEVERLFAYENFPLPIGYGQTISQPFIVALMTDLLEIKAEDIILEVGTGSGYQAAILATLAKEVFSLEIVDPLAVVAAERLHRLGYENVTVQSGDGYQGWPDRAPFNGIILTAAALDVPPPLVSQLAPGGRMVLPIGPPGGRQRLIVLNKDVEGNLAQRTVLDVAFVPLTGRHGEG
jgi:protein-L-isoaspartate(D-aspartate) O-methyltransferase